MNRYITLSMIAVVSLGLAAGVSAAGKGRYIESRYSMPSFVQLDSNQDNMISVEEFEAFRAQRVSQRSEQGRLMRNINSTPMFEKLDINGDQMIDQSEFENMPCNTGQRNGRGMGKTL